MGFTPDEADDLIRLLLNTLRYGGASTVLEGADIRDPAFAPRNREISVWREGSAPGVLSWMPMRGLNGRLDLLQRVFARRGIGADPREVLDDIWRFLTAPTEAWAKTLVQVHGDRDGAVWRLASDRFEIVPGVPERVPLRCDRCGQLWWTTVAEACPSFHCDGRLAPVQDPERLAENHYARLYRELEPIGMRSRSTPPSGSPRRPARSRTSSCADTSTFSAARRRSSSALTSARFRPCCCATCRLPPPITCSAPAGPDGGPTRLRWW